MKRAIQLSVLAAILAFPAAAQADTDGLMDWSVSPWTGSVDDLNYTVGGQAYGSMFSADEPLPQGFATKDATGAASINGRIERDYDSGLTLAIKGTFELYHDHLSGDNYGSDFLQKLYGSAQTGLGRVEVGMADGAAYSLAIVGPSINGETTIDNPNATFFRDPSTGQAFVNIFTLNSATEASLNYAKISYYTPRLFGVQLGVTFTPSEGKDVLPFLNVGQHVSNRQQNMFEAAVNYSDTFGPFTASLASGFTFAHNADKTPGHEGLTDWDVGSQLDWAINDDFKLSVGGAYRHSNAYAFNINDVRADGRTESLHLSTVLSYGSWSLGGEIGNATAEGTLGSPTLGIHGYEISGGYQVNTNLQLNAGWQKLVYTRDAGVFYNAAPRIDLDAVFLHAVLNI